MLQDKNAASDNGTSHGRESSASTANAPDFFGTVAAMDAATALWHREACTDTSASRVMAMHRANFELWHLEDDARSQAASAEEIAAIKRTIDSVNQQRNDHAEAVDVELLEVLAGEGLPRTDAPLHSETPGHMLDRLSILSLKRFHTEEESRRANAEAAHRDRNLARLAILVEQTRDLTTCLQDLWKAIECGERRFKRYHQLKMYNDPELNPVMYRVADQR